jgi:outer membrane protein assembly factor BamB
MFSSAPAFRLGLVGCLALAACALGPKRGVPPHRLASQQARDVFAPVFTKHVSRPAPFELRPQEWGGIAVDEERKIVYAGGDLGVLWALDGMRGEELWRIAVDGAFVGRPLLLEEGKRMLFVTGDGVVTLMDLEARRALWKYEMPGLVPTSPVVAEGLVFLATTRNEVIALAYDSGEWHWEYKRDLPTDFSVKGRAGLAYEAPQHASGEAGLIYSAFDDGQIAALRADSGDVVWVASVAPTSEDGVPDADSTPIVDRDAAQLVVAGISTGVIGLDLGTGAEKWRTPIDGVTNVVSAPGLGYIAVSALQGIFGLGLAGEIRWQERVDPGVLSEPVLIDDRFLTSHTEGGLMAFDVQSGELLARFDLGTGITSQPILARRDHRVYVTTNRGALVSLALADRMEP